MVVRLSKRVRLRDTHITGEIFFRFEQDGEIFYWITWDVNEDGDSELIRECELDSAERLLSQASPRYRPTAWSDRKFQLADRELNQAIYPEPATKGYPRQRR